METQKIRNNFTHTNTPSSGGHNPCHTTRLKWCQLTAAQRDSSAPPWHTSGQMFTWNAQMQLAVTERVNTRRKDRNSLKYKREASSRSPGCLLAATPLKLGPQDVEIFGLFIFRSREMVCLSCLAWINVPNTIVLQLCRQTHCKCRETLMLLLTESWRAGPPGYDHQRLSQPSPPLA